MRKEYIRILIILAVNFVCAGVFFAILDSLGIREKVYSDPLLNVLVGGGLSVFMILITFLLYTFLDKRPLSTFGFKIKKVDVLFSVLISLGVLLIHWLFILVLEKFGLIKITYTSDYVSSHHYLLILPFFLGWVIAALHEEVTNRAYIYSNMRHLKTGTMLIISSLLFAILHVFKGLNPFYFISLFTGGILFMYIYVQSGSVWAGTIIHSVMNFSGSFFLNDNPNMQMSLFLLKDIQEENAMPLLFGFQIIFQIIIIIATRRVYRKKIIRKQSFHNQQSSF